MAGVRLKSLRTKILMLLALGGSLVASAGLWITYTTTVSHFEAQLIEQGNLLASSLDHSAMVADTTMQVQHVVNELSLSPYINNITVVAGDPPEILASSIRSWNGMRLDLLADRHMGEHLQNSIAQGEFGHHFELDRDTLILIRPLGLHLGNLHGHDSAKSPSSTAPEHNMMHEHGVISEHGTTHGQGPNQDTESIAARDQLPYRGIIMLALDNREASAASSKILWLLCSVLVAAVLIMMNIAYFIVDRQILDRLAVIRRAMIGQNTTADATPIPITANDEISDLGRAFNNMIDRIEAETKRREGAVKDLKDSEERFRSIVDNSPTKIHIKDVEGRYVLINRVSEMLLGLSEEEVVGKTAYEIFPDTQADDFRTHDQAVLDTGQTQEQEEQWALEDRAHTFLTIKFPIRDGDGKITAIGAIGTDITERKLAEEVIRTAMKEAEIASRTKTEFLANMSHELRTPLNAIIGFSEIIKEETLGPVGSTKYREYADDINESGQHLLDLINDILDLSKVESGTDNLQEGKIEIPAIIRSTLKLVEHRTEQGGVNLELDYSDQLPMMRADERKLKQILVNLLSNAVKFTDAGGEVTFRAWCQMDSGYVFQIVDTGIGIAPSDVPKALSHFGQVEGDLNRQYEGTGLGLPLTKALVELHGGVLDLQSEVGVGTTVTVRFPADRIVTSLANVNPLDAGDRAAS